MNQGLERIEGALRTALREAAEELHPVAHPLPPPERAGVIHRIPPRQRLSVMALALVAAVALTVIGATVYLSATKQHAPNTVSVTDPTSPPTTATAPEPAAPSGVGPEIKLARTSNADTDFLVHLAAVQGTPMTDPVIVQTPGRAPVIVDKPGCITIAYPGPAGYQGGCVPSPAATLTALNAEAAPSNTEATWYLVWTQVPEGASYVVYSYLSQLSWQRPIGGVSVFTAFAKKTDTASDRPFARAYDASGRQIGEAHTFG